MKHTVQKTPDQLGSRVLFNADIRVCSGISRFELQTNNYKSEQASGVSNTAFPPIPPSPLQTIIQHAARGTVTLVHPLLNVVMPNQYQSHS